MNADLEGQLEEMGADYRAVVDRLRAARTVEPRAEGPGLRSRSTVEWLIAASLLIALCLTVHIQTLKHSNTQTLSSYGAREYHQSIHEMISSQHPDGSWQNDFLTRRNAEVLSRCGGPAARIAYKKAMRNLRARGVL